jgi:orotate phosphoribosyltransferase
MLQIIGLTKEEILGLDPEKVNYLLTMKEILYVAEILGAYWKYDYQAAKEGRVGKHALLNSGLHSDGFIASRFFLKYPNIRKIMALQLAARFDLVLRIVPHPTPFVEKTKPEWIAGIPNGATFLGKDLAELLGVKNAEMKKQNGHIVLASPIAPGETPLLVEDVVTEGTGLKETVLEIFSKQPKARIASYFLALINRGGLSEIKVESIGSFIIVPAIVCRMNDWEPSECPLCKLGSEPIKPKATNKNWRLITTSQLS